ncbi:MAG: SulP family inorganic anion transporter [Clostridia bacterium]|nr:SulP family inorganic anion transporter [Clostridia bacterium]
MLKPKLFSIIKHRKTELTSKQLLNDIIAGIIVAIIALPLSIALGISSGVSPDKGLITAIVGGFFISFLGGSRVQIGGPTGAFVVIVYGIIQKYGIEGLIISTILAGLILIVFGFLKLGSLIKYVPYPIVTGFTSGIAVVLLSTQIKDLFGLNIKEVPSEFIMKWKSYITHISTVNLYALALGIVSILIIVFWPKFNKTIPGSLIALIFTTIAVSVFKLPVETIGSKFGSISYHFSLPNFSGLDLTDITNLLHPAITIALLAGIESLLSAVVADGMIGKKHNSNMELIAQGTANIASAVFGGIPATGAIARTAANVKNGGRTPVAGVVHALTLLLIMLIFMKYATLIPMVTLAAILVVVSYNMSEWREFKELLKSPKSDVSVLLITFSFTVLFDLVVAIEVGMVLAMFLFIKKMSDNIEVYSVNTKLEENDNDYIESSIDSGNDRVMVYEINGPLFFGSINNFLDVMNEIHKDIDILIIRMRNVPVMDASGFQALKNVYNRCKKSKKIVLFAEVKKQPLNVMINKGFYDELGSDRFFDDLDKALREADEISFIKKRYAGKKAPVKV